MFARSKRWRIVLIVLAVPVLCFVGLVVLGLMISPFGVEPISDFVATRSSHRTQLRTRMPAPQSWEPFPDLPGVREVQYPSGSLSLKAWLALPESDALKSAKGVPVMTYLHGGFGADSTDLEAVAAFRAQGFAVFLPTYRGENGNPGDHEMFYGELDDVRAAIQWVAREPGLDGERIVVFGHSAGGLLASLLSLFEAPRVLDTGSTGGLYASNIFDQFELPFQDTEQERALRLFAPHVAQMKQAHFACVGTEDVPPLQVSKLLRVVAKDQKRLQLQLVPGEHGTAVEPCVQAYLTRVLGLLP